MPKRRQRRIEEGLIDGRISRSIWKLALPMMISGALQNLFSIVDLYFVGRLGHVEVAALSIAGVVLSVLVMFVMGIAIGTTALIAHCTGQKNHEQADEVLGQTLLLGAMASAIMLAIALWAVEPLLALFGATEGVLVFGAEYLRIVFGWSIVIFAFMGINQAIRGAGDAKTPLKALIVANVINIFLDPMLIMGYGPFPEMGVAGSAAATVFSRGVGVMFLLIHITIGHATVHLKLQNLKPNPVILKRILNIGSFASIQVLIREISFLLLMRLVASYGPVILAAYGIGARLRMIIMVPGFGFANSASILAGQNLGANQPERAARSVWQTVAYYECIAIPTAAAYIVFAPHLVGFFNDHLEVVRVGASFLRFLGVSFPFLAISLVLGQAMNGAGDTRTPTIVTAIGQLVFRIPVAYLLALTVGMGPTGVWLGINASDAAQGLLMALVFRSGRWKRAYARHKRILEGRPVSSFPDSGTPRHVGKMESCEES